MRRFGVSGAATRGTRRTDSGLFINTDRYFCFRLEPFGSFRLKYCNNK